MTESHHPTAKLMGTGSYLPPDSMTNPELFEKESIRGAFDLERARTSLRRSHQDVESLSPEEVFDRWAQQVTGIRARRVADPGGTLTTESMAAEASKAALRDAGLEPGEVDLILFGTVTPSDGVPNAACTLGELLGIPKVGGYTINGACAAFVQALGSAYAFIRSGMAETVLAVASDTLTRIVNYADPTTAVLFSDGASAAVLSASKEPGVLGPPQFTGDYKREHLFIVGQGWESEEEPVPKLHMGGGPRVLKRAILAMEGVATRALQEAGVGWESVDLVVPHQANLRITKGLEGQLDLPRGRVIHTIAEYGNCSAATVGVALDEALRGEHGPVPDPARMVLTSVGGGYTTAALVLDVSKS